MVIHKIKLFVLALLTLASVTSLVAPAALAAEDVPGIVPDSNTTPVTDVYSRATVTKIIDSGEEMQDGEIVPYQKILVTITTGEDADKSVEIDNGKLFTITKDKLVAVGDEIIIAKPAYSPKPDFYYIVDVYRGNRLLWLGVFFVVVTLVVGKRRGLTSLVGLGLTTIILFYFMVPALLQGKSPLAVTLLGALAITFLSIYISHGFSKRTSVALFSTLITLAITVGLSFFSVWFARLSGTGSEDSFFLQYSNASIDLRGLLLAGIIISVLGILDDITTGTAAAVEEIHKANPLLSAKELFSRGLSVGREHIASLVNTLLLAYTGSSLPLIILFSMQKQLPVLMTINSAFLAEEIVRTIVGSLALIFAVPITTGLSSLVWGHKQP